MFPRSGRSCPKGCNVTCSNSEKVASLTRLPHPHRARAQALAGPSTRPVLPRLPPPPLLLFSTTTARAPPLAPDAPEPVKGTRHVQLVRRDGRDVSTLYGREGGGGLAPDAPERRVRAWVRGRLLHLLQHAVHLRAAAPPHRSAASLQARLFRRASAHNDRGRGAAAGRRGATASCVRRRSET